MKPIVIRAVVVFICSVVISWQVVAKAGSESTAVEPVANEDQRLNTFLDSVFEREVAQSPIRQAYLGRSTDQKGQWDDFSDAYADQKIEETKGDLEQLTALAQRVREYVGSEPTGLSGTDRARAAPGRRLRQRG